MTTTWRTALAAALACCLALGCGEPAEQPSARGPAAQATPTAGALQLGAKLPDFTLPDYFTGEPMRLADAIDGQTYVCVIWHSPACPCAHNCATAIAAELTREKYPDLRIIGVTSDHFWDYDWFKNDLRQQIDDGIVNFPVLLDKDRKVMELYGAQRTPTVWLADKEGIIRFWGAPENTIAPGGSDYEFLLKDALDDLRAGRPVQVPSFTPIGCLIETSAGA
jgi:alkyl hydroperoxide reductase subunit AhpC